MRKLFFLALFGALAFALLVSWFDNFIKSPLQIKENFVINMPQGTGSRTLANQLIQNNLVSHELIVRLAIKFYGYDKKLKAGEFLINPNMSLLDILEKISSGKVIMHKITIPEGLTSYQVIKLINDNEFLTGNIDFEIEEGTILPETYTFYKGTKKEDIIKQAQKSMKDSLKKVWEERKDNLPLNSKEELLILASIIEKETGINSEREKVSSVFINRLNNNMLLQTDPTVIYALTLGKTELGRSLKRKDLQIDSPYNTYKYIGLPPKPICNPGIESLKAAANPLLTPYFYFVADGNGGHNFSKTLAEHNKNIQKWLKKIRK